MSNRQVLGDGGAGAEPLDSAMHEHFVRHWVGTGDAVEAYRITTGRNSPAKAMEWIKRPEIKARYDYAMRVLADVNMMDVAWQREHHRQMYHLCRAEREYGTATRNLEDIGKTGGHYAPDATTINMHGDIKINDLSDEDLEGRIKHLARQVLTGNQFSRNG